MTRTRHERRVTQGVQQVIHGTQLPQHAELLLQNALDVFATQRADFVLGRGTREESCLESRLLFSGERARTTSSRTVFQARQAFTVEALDPVLHLSPAELGLCRHFVGSNTLSK